MDVVLADVFDPTKVPTSPGWLLLYFFCGVVILTLPHLIKTIDDLMKLKYSLKMDEEFQKKRELERQFEDKVYEPEEEEMGLRHKFYQTSTKTEAFVDSLYEELSDDLTIIFGDDYKNKFQLPGVPASKRGFDDPSCHALWAIRLLLARRGKITRHTGIIYGFEVGGDPEYEWQIAFLKRIEYHLMKNHPEEGDNVKIYLEPTIIDPDGLWRTKTALRDRTHAYYATFGLGYWYKLKGIRFW